MDEFETVLSFGNPQAPLLEKWLTRLFRLQCVVLVISLAGYIPGLGKILSWLGRLAQLGVVAVLFMLTPGSLRYRKAAIFWLIVQVLQLTALVAPRVGSIAALPVSVLSLLATYQEYHAHADVIAGPLPRVSRRWHSLFNAQIFVIVLASFVVPVVSVLAVVMGADADLATTLSLVLINLPAMVIQVIYLWNLHQTKQCFREV